jgi:WD40 repeat protein
MGFTAQIWDAETGKELQKLEGHKGNVFSVAFSPDGKQVVTGSADKTTRIWNAETGNLLLELNDHPDSATPDEVVFIRGGGKRAWGFEESSPSVMSAAFSPDGKKVLSGCRDNTARIWDWEQFPPPYVPAKIRDF